MRTIKTWKFGLRFLMVLSLFSINELVHAQDSIDAATDSITNDSAGTHNDKPEIVDYKRAYSDALTKKIYRLGQISKADNQYGPLVMIIEEKGSQYAIKAPGTEGFDISRVDIEFLHGRPYFLVIGRYKLFLVDMEKEAFGPAMQPGITVEYGQDGISGILAGLQLFGRHDEFLLGIAADYGLFCFNVADYKQPKELIRFSSQSADRGQPYLFLNQNADGLWNGILCSSDTTKKSKTVTGFYTATKAATDLFQHVDLIEPTADYKDPLFNPQHFLHLQLQYTKVDTIKWIFDLTTGQLLQPVTTY